MPQISLTESAAKRIKTFLEERGKGKGLRLGIKTSGCSGLAYIFEFVDHVDKDDLCFKDKGVSLFIDPKSMIYLDGVEVDYGKDGLNEGFKFNNPNATNECGCGESFTV